MFTGELTITTGARTVGSSIARAIEMFFGPMSRPKMSSTIAGLVVELNLSLLKCTSLDQAGFEQTKSGKMSSGSNPSPGIPWSCPFLARAKFIKLVYNINITNQTNQEI